MNLRTFGSVISTHPHRPMVATAAGLLGLSLVRLCVAAVRVVSMLMTPAAAFAHDTMANEREALSIALAITVIGFGLLVIVAIRSARPRPRKHRRSRTVSYRKS